MDKKIIIGIIFLIIVLTIGSLIVVFNTNFQGLNGINGINGINGVNGINISCFIQSDNPIIGNYSATLQNGTLISSSTDASIPINKAINVTTGIILFSVGNFITQNSINITSEVELIGNGPDTTQIKQGNFDGNIINIIPNTQKYFISIKDLQLIGNLSHTGHGIYSNINALDVIISNTYISYVQGDALHLDYVWGYRIDKCKFEYSLGNGTWIGSGQELVYSDNLCYGNLGLAGIYINKSSSYNTYYGNFIYYNAKNGIYIGTSSYHNIFSNNQIFYNSNSSSNTYYGLYNDGGDGTVLNGNHFDGGNKERYCLYWFYASTGSITGNVFRLANSKNVMVLGGTDNQFKSNVGFVTENSGSISGKGNFAVSHGLFTTPTTIEISAYNITITYAVTYRSTTSFNITCSDIINTQTFDWMAIYKP